MSKNGSPVSSGGWCAQSRPLRASTWALTKTAPHAKREGDEVMEIPAGLSVFRVGEEGKPDLVRKYDIDVGPFTKWWTGMIQLA
jgi:hypothetical protein